LLSGIHQIVIKLSEEMLFPSVRKRCDFHHVL
jgi:hypothetical protein